MSYTKLQLSSLVLLRILIGWHLLYEGVVKLFQPNWSAVLYLEDSSGLFRPMFMEIAGNETLLNIINLLNQYGLVLVGLALICGAFTKIAAWSGVVMLLFYTMSHPAFIGADYLMPMEGSYLWIDKNVIEMGALIVIWLFPTSKIIGVDRFLQKYLGRLI